MKQCQKCKEYVDNRAYSHYCELVKNKKGARWSITNVPIGGPKIIKLTPWEYETY